MRVEANVMTIPESYASRIEAAGRAELARLYAVEEELARVNAENLGLSAEVERLQKRLARLAREVAARTILARSQPEAPEGRN
jgi:hypothetical protein